jgi:hypothetical protein
MTKQTFSFGEAVVYTRPDGSSQSATISGVEANGVEIAYHDSPHRHATKRRESVKSVDLPRLTKFAKGSSFLISEPSFH